MYTSNMMKRLFVHMYPHDSNYHYSYYNSYYYSHYYFFSYYYDCYHYSICIVIMYQLCIVYALTELSSRSAANQRPLPPCLLMVSTFGS